MERYADQVSALMGAIGVERATWPACPWAQRWPPTWPRGDIAAPTLITFGARDIVTSTRFAAPLTDGIADSIVVVFDHLSHAGLHEDPDAFNTATLDFLLSLRV